MFKTLIFSIRKSKLLSKIAKESMNRDFSLTGISNKMFDQLKQGRTLNKRELYIEQLLSLLAKDTYTVNLLLKYNRTFEDIRKIIGQLELNGAGQVVKGHYVAVSAISFLEQLEFVLKYWDGENFKVGDSSNRNSALQIINKLFKSFD